MLIISSLLVFFLSAFAVYVFIRRSYIKNRAESLFIIIAIVGFNVTSCAILLYSAQYGLNHYLLNKYLFLSQNILYAFRRLRFSIFGVSNLLNLGRFLFLTGSYCFISMVISRRLSWKRDVVLLFPVVFILLNISSVYIRVIERLKYLSLPFAQALNFFDRLGTLCMVITLLVLSVRIIRFSRACENPSLRKSILLLLIGLNLVWFEYLIILDLTPSSVANIYRESFLANMLSDFVVSTRTQSSYLLFYVLTVSLVILSFALVIFAAMQILRYHNYQKAGSITVNASIVVNNAQSLIPFLHTFKNQLVSLHQFESLMDRDNFEESFPVIQSITRELIQMIDNLYENSREIKLNISRCDLGRCIGKAVNTVEEVKEIPIRWRQDKAVPAMIDPEYIQHAIENILYNSADACEGNPDGEIRILAEERGRFVRITISDNGVGIGRESLKRIFEPFFSTKKKSHSWGMGLNHVSKIIKAHHGKVDYFSEPGFGTDVILSIPTGK